MDKRGFILYEALLIFMIVASILTSCCILLNRVGLKNREIEKKIEQKEKDNNINYERCDYKCLIKKGT